MKYSISREEAESVLKTKFQLPAFYDEQWVTIERLLSGERVLLIEKTGYGKSLCFQFPATIFDGTTVIFSPLIALMRDQVNKLNSLGINARCINSEQEKEANESILAEALSGRLKILYIAPERQENSQWIETVRQMKLGMVVVDEAHCISVWGHDFRPAFRRIKDLVKLLPAGLPVLATTATATKRVEKDIAEQMGIDITVIRGNLLRDNFRLFVAKVKETDEKLAWLGQNISQLEGNGIIYSGTRADTELYTRWLEYLNIPVIGYNAGMDPVSRIDIEKGLMENRWKCVISTNALGMGIDKADIRFIIHTQMPQSPVHYYQEIGRAGRDGKPASIILLYNPEDRDLPEAFIEGTRPSISKYNKAIATIQSELLGEREILKKANLKTNQFRIIKNDLLEQGIIREVTYGKSKKYEYIHGAPALQTKAFEDLKKLRMGELEEMIRYCETNSSRMKFLCDYLGDNIDSAPNTCDNSGLPKYNIQISREWKTKISRFHESYFPELPAGHDPLFPAAGVAASLYGVTNVGTSIHRCKYENGGDFPDYLVGLAVQAFRNKLDLEKFDLMVYVPPTKSGDLMKNFAAKLSEAITIPLSHNLHKTRETQEQKILENSWGKQDNVKDAFDVKNKDEFVGKNILLIDDIYDSGATVKELGKLFSSLGAKKLVPLVIAKTVGGDLA